MSAIVPLPPVQGARPRHALLGATACHVTTLHPERGLARALVQHLAQELPDVEFTLDERPDVDAVWVCGYDLGSGARIAALRARHPHALLIVTAKGPEDEWSAEVLAAGADHALSWPLDLERLSQLLRRRAPVVRGA
jgi:hypothetical protein